MAAENENAGIMIISADTLLARQLCAALQLYCGVSTSVFAYADKALEAFGTGEAAPGAIIFAPPAEDMTLGAFQAALAEKEKAATGLIGIFPAEKAQEGQSAGLARQDVFLMPLRLGALIDRVRRHLRAQTGLKTDDIYFGPFRLIFADGMLVHEKESDKAVILTEKERAILVALYDHQGKTVGRQELLEKVWGYADGIETHTLETHIYRLRQKIEQDPARPQWLVTEETGYRLIP